jgi:hypothetical protein
MENMKTETISKTEMIKEAAEKAIARKDIVGGDISSMCTKCKIETEHTIASKVGEKIGKVRCKTCGSTHRYLRPGATLTTTRRAPKLTPEENWNLCMQNASAKKRTPYTLSGAYKLSDVIDHSRFGLGVVTLLYSTDKIQVTFKEGEKILIMGMQATS